MKRARSWLAALLLAGSLSACGGGDDNTAGTGGSPAGGGTGGGSGGAGTGATVGTGGSNVVTPNQSCTSPSPPFTAEEQQIVDLPADSWFSPPNTMIRPLCPTTITGCANVIDAWSGGTYDPVHHEMLIFGGGHSDYSGNEVYAFDLATLTWSRLTDPSSDSYQDQDPLPDGQPVSRHSYDGIAYIAHADRMFVHGGSEWKSGGGTGVSWAFDPAAKTWSNRDPSGAFQLSNCCSEGSAYDPVSKRVFFHVTKALMAYDYDQNAWSMVTDYGYPPYWPRYEAWGNKVGVVDTKRELLWFLGGNLVMTYDIAQDNYVTDDWITSGGSTYTNAADVSGHPEQEITTGGGEIIEAEGPGVDYDTAADDLVAWVGGAPWILELDSKVWSQSQATGGPAKPSDRGTYGRFRYVPRLNVFVLVNSVDEDVAFYKHTAGCGNPP